jgi:hypothetical protein
LEQLEALDLSWSVLLLKVMNGHNRKNQKQIQQEIKGQKRK